MKSTEQLPHSLSILIVDDERVIAHAHRKILEPLGYGVRIASSRAECMRMMREIYPDLILLDVVLRSESGIELCREIKRLPHEPKPFVVLYSGMRFSSESVQQGLAAGADGYIDRNIPETEFLRWVETYSRLKRSENSLYLREKEYRTLFETLTEGVVFQDGDGNIIDLNPAAEHILGRSREQILGLTSEAESWAALREDGSEFPGKEHPAMRALKTGTFQQDVVMAVFNPAKREYRWIRIDAVPLTEEDSEEVERVYTVFSDVTEKKATEDDLKRSREELLKLSHHLQSIREEQSAHIAGEIHDDLGQSLTSVEMVLTLLESELEKNELQDEAVVVLMEELREQVNSTIEKTRSLARDIRPTILDTAGIFEAIAWQLDRFEQHSGIYTHVTIPQQSFSLGTQRDLALFRIVQEALNNISHHSRASKVQFMVTIGKAELKLRIEDNGIGFSHEQITDSEGFGLINMRERAIFLEGELDIESSEQMGTSIHLKVPLEKRV